jgi:hypothetical protein
MGDRQSGVQKNILKRKIFSLTLDPTAKSLLKFRERKIHICGIIYNVVYLINLNNSSRVKGAGFCDWNNESNIIFFPISQLLAISTRRKAVTPKEGAL